MTIVHKAAVAALALGLGFAATPAFAEAGAARATEGTYGARGCGACPGGGVHGSMCYGMQGGCCGPGGHGTMGGHRPGFFAVPSGDTAAMVPYWLADASLSIGNAANTADMLSMEEGLHVPAPQLLGSQAQFLLEATSRSLAALAALRQNAMSTNPAAEPAIRAAAGHLAAAQTQAMQVVRATRSGIVGPAFGVPVRSTLAHLLAAEQAMIDVGRAFDAPEFATAGACVGGGAAMGDGGAGEAP